MDPAPKDDLSKVAREEARVPLWKDFLYFLAHNKKWWLLPILLVVGLVGLLVVLTNTAAAPFIYTLF